MEAEKILLSVSPMKGVTRFRKNDKLSPQYIGLCEILEKVGKVACRLSLPLNFSGVHLVFQVSMLPKFHEDQLHVLDFSLMQLDENLTYVQELIDILDRQDYKLRSKDIALVKVWWRVQSVEKESQETEHDMWNKQPHLFVTPSMTLNSFKEKCFFKRGIM